MEPALIQRLRQMFGVELEGLTGASISGEIPLTNELINGFIAQRLAAAQGVVAAAHVDAQDEDHIGVELSMRGPRMLPSVRMVARIEQQPELPHPAVLGLRWSIPGMGPLGLFAAPALTWLKALPPGIRAEGDWIVVDIAEALRSQGLGELLRYLSKLRIHTRRGVVVVQFELRIGAASR